MSEIAWDPGLIYELAREAERCGLDPETAEASARVIAHVVRAYFTTIDTTINRLEQEEA